MKAVLWTGINKLDYIDVPEPRVGHQDVLIKVRAAGVCSTDISIIKGLMGSVSPPLILGHEFAGEVVEIGAGVDTMEVGDQVTADSALSCGKCYYCRRGEARFCEKREEVGISVNGGWAEYISIPAGNTYRIPDTVSFEEAAILDPETLDAIEDGEEGSTDTVLILGCGFGALVFVQLAKLRGARKVILSGTRENRLEMGRRLGADFVVYVEAENLEERIAALTDDRGPELVIEAAGVDTTVRQAVKLVCKGGRVILYGVHGHPIDGIPIDDIVLKDLCVKGALKRTDLWKKMIELVSSGNLKLSALITHRFPLSEAQKAFETVDRKLGGVIKVILVP